MSIFLFSFTFICAQGERERRKDGGREGRTMCAICTVPGGMQRTFPGTEVSGAHELPRVGAGNKFGSFVRAVNILNCLNSPKQLSFREKNARAH